MPPIRELNNRYVIDEGCYISRVNMACPTPLHTHDFLEISYVFKGRGIHYVNGTEYPVGAGDAIFINYGSTHAIEVIGNLSYADIIIKPEFISASLKGVENAFALLELEGFRDFAKTVDRNDRIMHFSPTQRRQIESLIMLAHAEQETDCAGKELLLRSIFNTLLTVVFRKMALPMRKESGIGAELLGYIKSRCAEPLTVQEFARANHYNPAYFSRLFKKQTGLTFTEYLTSCRIDLACRLLRDTEMKVDDIAAESGFSDRTKFFKIFSERMGTTPLGYRKGKK